MKSLAIVLMFAFVAIALEAAKIPKVRDVTADVPEEGLAPWTRSLSKDCRVRVKIMAKNVMVVNAAVEDVFLKAHFLLKAFISASRHVSPGHFKSQGQLRCISPLVLRKKATTR